MAEYRFVDAEQVNVKQDCNVFIIAGIKPAFPFV